MFNQVKKHFAVVLSFTMIVGFTVPVYANWSDDAYNDANNWVADFRQNPQGTFAAISALPGARQLNDSEMAQLAQHTARRGSFAEIQSLGFNSALSDAEDQVAMNPAVAGVLRNIHSMQSPSAPEPKPASASFGVLSGLAQEVENGLGIQVALARVKAIQGIRPATSEERAQLETRNARQTPPTEEHKASVSLFLTAIRSGERAEDAAHAFPHGGYLGVRD